MLEAGKGGINRIYINLSYCQAVCLAGMAQTLPQFFLNVFVVVGHCTYSITVKCAFIMMLVVLAEL